MPVKWLTITLSYNFCSPHWMTARNSLTYCSARSLSSQLVARERLSLCVRGFFFFLGFSCQVCHWYVLFESFFPCWPCFGLAEVKLVEWTDSWGHHGNYSRQRTLTFYMACHLFFMVYAFLFLVCHCHHVVGQDWSQNRYTRCIIWARQAGMRVRARRTVRLPGAFA